MQESKFVFLGYRVFKIECLIDDAFGATPEEMRQNVKVVNKLDKKDHRLAEVILQISVESKSGSFKFNLEMKGGFRGNDSMTDGVFKKLCSVNAPAILYPYARSIVASYTALANIPTITLPVATFVGRLEKDKKKTAEASQ